jgi:hypothetical protein
MIGDLIEIFGSGQVIYQPAAGKCVLFKKFNGTSGPNPNYAFYITNGDFKCSIRCGTTTTTDYASNYDNCTQEGISKTIWNFFVTRNAYFQSNVSQEYFNFQGMVFNEWTPT